jgi:hypothetical protein
MYADIMTANGFDSPWYWLLVALLWVRTIQWTLGVPSDVFRAAQKGDAQAKKDALAMMDIHIRSVTRDFNHFGTILVLLTSFVLASFATMGFWNDIAVLQGVFFIAFPMAIIGAIGVRLAYRLQKTPASWDEFISIYNRQRWMKAGFALLFIIASMFWALYLEIRPFLEHLGD